MRHLKIVLYYSHIVFAVFLIISFLSSKISPHRKPVVLGEHTAEVSVTVGKAERYSLFGYSSSRATVKLEGVGLLGDTSADTAGYFEFINFLTPAQTKEFCLTTIDTEQLIAPPVCFARPQNVQNKKIGPFLLPPTIALGSNQTSSSAVSGKTIPGTEVTIRLFTDEPGLFGSTFNFFPAAYAQGQNNKELTTTASSDGSYTSTVTAKKEGKVRLFSQSTYNQQKAPKSFTLTLSIFAAWYIWIISLLPLLARLFNPLTLMALLLAIALVLLYKRYRKLLPVFVPKRKRELGLVLWEKKQLAIKTHQEISRIEQEPLAIPDEHPLFKEIN